MSLTKQEMLRLMAGGLRYLNRIPRVHAGIGGIVLAWTSSGEDSFCWCESVPTPGDYQPGVLAFDFARGDLYATTGGSDIRGAKRWEMICETKDLQ